MRLASSATSRHLVPIAVLLAASACGKLRPDESGATACPDWEQSVQPVLTAQCQSCHGPERAEAGYRIDGYGQALARRPDGSARVVPGDAASALVLAARGELPSHDALAEADRRVLETWALQCGAAPRGLRLHTQAWSTPTDPEFHGSVLRRSGYQMEACRDCHGADLSGGPTQVSCTSGCHDKGVLDCSTCHGDAVSAAPGKALSGATSTASRGVGAHQVHLTFGCDTCHVVPNAAEDEGHYRRDGAPDLDGAEVALSGMAGANAVYDRSNASCAGSYCHSPAGNDTRATNTAPTWNRVGQGETDCGTCHGLPPSTHQATELGCEVCHARALADGKPLAATHVNGAVEVGDAQGTCSGCHGDGTSSAPPKPLVGAADRSNPAVGAHRVHLEASRFRGPIACNECHQVPDALNAPGHIDSDMPAEVFPTVAGVGIVARANGAQASYDREAATCTTYCHGTSTPSWTGDETEAQCGSCHGLPPQDGIHQAGTQLTQCVMCHAPTMDANGALKFTTDPVTGARKSTHLDGQVSFGIGPD